MTGSDALAQRFRRGRAELGALRFMLVMLCALLVIAGLLVVFLVEDGSRPLLVILAMIVTASAALKMLERPKADRLWAAALAAGATLLWAQILGLLPFPIQGA